MKTSISAVLGLTAALGLTNVMQASGWKADPAVVAETHEARKREFNFDEAKVPAYQLPESLVMANGDRVQTPEQWAARRQEILELFREHVFGRRPGKPDQLRFETIESISDAMEGKATLKRIMVHSQVADRTHQFEITLFLPNAARGPVPVYLLINNRRPDNADPTRQVKRPFWPAEEVIKRGYGIAAIKTRELSPDTASRYTQGVIELFEGSADSRKDNAFKAIAAWSWGASRAMDYFETDDRIDHTRVAVVGHSRGGKAALWTGAEDPRFALVISNDSGCTGAAISRRRFGETVAIINTRFPHWFCENYRKFSDREHELPVDQHMLMALIAPRGLYVASADKDLWADPRGEFLSLVHSSDVYALWGHKPIEDSAMPALDSPAWFEPRGYHIRSGEHDLTIYDWQRFMDAGDKLWKRSADSP